MQNITNKLNCKAELWGLTTFVNELGEQDKKVDKIKDIYCNVLPATATQKWGSTVNETITHSHKIMCRSLSIKKPKVDMFFMYKGLKYEFIYWDPDFNSNEFINVFTELVIE